MRFIPNGSDLDNITSRAFKEKCAIYWGDVEGPAEEIRPAVQEDGHHEPST